MNANPWDVTIDPEPRTRPASDAARRTFDRLIPELLTSIAPTGKDNGERADYMRFWTIDDAGKAQRIPMSFVERLTSQLPNRAGKDLLIKAVASWCLAYKPAAFVMSTETWGVSLKGEEDIARHQAFVRRHGGTMPSLQDPAIREELKRDFGLEARTSLIVIGEMHGLAEPITRIAHLVRGRFEPSTAEEGALCKMRWVGILSGYPRFSDVPATPDGAADGLGLGGEKAP